MVITERQGKILNKIVQEYINSVVPVSSKLLEKKYDFGVSPATIRNEMQKLTDAGFLLQPHTSAGRVPTDKAYRFFVDKLFEKGFLGFKGFKMETSFKKEIEDSFKFIQAVTKTLSSISSGLAISYLPEEKVLWKEGWERVFQEPEFKKRDSIFDFTQLLESFEKDIKKLKLNSEIKVFIGKENPFSRKRDFSIIISQCRWPGKKQGVISLLGPKRMAYDKNLALINHLKELLEKI